MHFEVLQLVLLKRFGSLAIGTLLLVLAPVERASRHRIQRCVTHGDPVEPWSSRVTP